MEDYSWCERAVFAGEAELQSYFSTDPQYYFGDPNAMRLSDFDDPKLHLALPVLSFNPDGNSFTRAEDILGHETELGAYYRALVERAYHYGHDFNSIRQYFWMRSSIVSKTGDFGIGFPWYDNSAEFSPMFKWITEGGEGETFFDVDQGWQLNGIIKGESVYFLESEDDFPINWETTDIYNNVALDLASLRAQVQANAAIVKGIIEALTAEVGVDVWTKYHYDDVTFGTEIWHPVKPKKAGFLGRLFGRK
ncbi:MAG: hypothetical protein ACPGVT_14290 [Maricaulaceae bacterium]